MRTKFFNWHIHTYKVPGYFIFNSINFLILKSLIISIFMYCLKIVLLCFFFYSEMFWLHIAARERERERERKRERERLLIGCKCLYSAIKFHFCPNLQFICPSLTIQTIKINFFFKTKGLSNLVLYLLPPPISLCFHNACMYTDVKGLKSSIKKGAFFG